MFVPSKYSVFSAVGDSCYLKPRLPVISGMVRLTVRNSLSTPMYGLQKESLTMENPSIFVDKQRLSDEKALDYPLFYGCCMGSVRTRSALLAIFYDSIGYQSSLCRDWVCTLADCFQLPGAVECGKYAFPYFFSKSISFIHISTSFLKCFSKIL